MKHFSLNGLSSIRVDASLCPESERRAWSLVVPRIYFFGATEFDFLVNFFGAAERPSVASCGLLWPPVAVASRGLPRGLAPRGALRAVSFSTEVTEVVE